LLVEDVDGEPVEVGRPVYAEIEHLTDELPPKERAAVVLRYGYDLAYDEIGAALGSSEEAARAAASSGIRRLRSNLHVDHACARGTLPRSRARRGSRRRPLRPDGVARRRALHRRDRTRALPHLVPPRGSGRAARADLRRARAAYAAGRGAPRARRILRGPPSR